MSGVKSLIDTNGGTIISVECHMANSLPGIIIVGFANKSVNEAKERIRGALTKSGIKLPPKRIVFNLAPADIPKNGSSFDLPMIVSVLAACGHIPAISKPDTAVIGEVGLDGSIRPVRGVIGKIIIGKKHGLQEFWIPRANLEQASLVPNIKIRAFESVKQLLYGLNQKDQKPTFPINISFDEAISPINFDQIAEQDDAKRALTVAAAGNHNIFMSGPPGSGKSMLAKALPSIMPSLKLDEILEITHLHSLASKNFGKIIAKRPFRSPHHTASLSSILGGGQALVPGEATLGHNGILFFDEFPEFKHEIIESLRQPLEDKNISVSRANNTVVFPANFLFVAAANPCPCGFYGTDKKCVCTVVQALNYKKKISGPVLDRIDIYIELKAVKHQKLLNNSKANETREFKKMVEAALNIQLKRQGKVNCLLEGDDLKAVCALSAKTKKLLDQAAAQMQLSARGYMRSLKVARTIADLEGKNRVGPQHIGEALQYRKKAFG